MAKFNNPLTRLKVKGIGMITQATLTDAMAQRLMALNPAYAKLIEGYGPGIKTGDRRNSGGSSGGKSSKEKKKDKGTD